MDQVLPFVIGAVIARIINILWDRKTTKKKLLNIQVKNPADPQQMEFKSYWLSGSRRAFYVGKTDTGLHMFKVAGINDFNKMEDTTDLTNEEVSLYISTANEALWA